LDLNFRLKIIKNFQILHSLTKTAICKFKPTKKQKTLKNPASNNFQRKTQREILKQSKNNLTKEVQRLFAWRVAHFDTLFLLLVSASHLHRLNDFHIVDGCHYTWSGNRALKYLSDLSVRIFCNDFFVLEFSESKILWLEIFEGEVEFLSKTRTIYFRLVCIRVRIKA
jgi:hypothetical protein